MSLASRVQKALDNTLGKYAPPSRAVYKRVTAIAGGDPLTGRPGTETFVDTKMNPQPYYSRPVRYAVGSYHKATIFDDVGGTGIGTAYILLASASAITLAELADDRLSFVLKNDAGVEEVFTITDFDDISVQGSNAAFSILVQSIKR